MKLVLGIGTLVLTLSAQADVAHLVNGDRITGQVDSLTGGELVMYTKYAGRIVIDVDQLRTLETERVLAVVLETGERMRGQLVADGVTQELVTRKGARRLGLGEIAQLYQPRITRAMGGAWNSRIDLNGIVSRGNSDTDSVAVRAESKLDRGDTEHTTRIAFDRADDGSDTTKDQGEADYTYRWFFSDGWYATAGTNYFTDAIKDVKHRVTVNVGAGHRFWDTSLGALSADLSAAEVFERLDGTDRVNPAIQWGLAYNRFFWGKRLEFFHEQKILKIIDADRGEVLSGALGLRVGLTERLDTHVRVDVRHETEPPDQREETDVTYALGVGFRL